MSVLIWSLTHTCSALGKHCLLGDQLNPMNGHVQGFYTIQYFPCPCLEHAWCDLPDLVLNYQDLGNSLSIFIRRKTVIYYKSPTYKYTAIHCIPQGLHLVQGQGILHLLEKVIVWNPVRGSVLVGRTDIFMSTSIRLS